MAKPDPPAILGRIKSVHEWLEEGVAAVKDNKDFLSALASAAPWAGIGIRGDSFPVVAVFAALDLSELNLQGVEMIRSDLQDADLQNAELANASRVVRSLPGLICEVRTWAKQICEEHTAYSMPFGTMPIWMERCLT